MAICNALTAGLSKSCDTNAGGVNKIWVADYATLVPTITSGEITAISMDPQNVVTTTGTVNNSIVAGAYVATTIEVTGDKTSVFVAGRIFKFTYNTQFGSSYWTGPVLSSSYSAGTGKTTITPDYTTNFAPVLGTVAGGAAPNNTSNSTVTTFMLFEIKTNKNVCNFTESVAIDMNNGTTFFNQVVTLVLSRRETTKRAFIEGLIDGQKQLLVVVLDSNGNYWLFGLNEGAYVTAIEGGSGTAKADANGYTVTMTAMEPHQAYQVTANAISIYFV